MGPFDKDENNIWNEIYDIQHREMRAESTNIDGLVKEINRFILNMNSSDEYIGYDGEFSFIYFKKLEKFEYTDIEGVTFFSPFQRARHKQIIIDAIDIFGDRMLEYLLK